VVNLEVVRARTAAADSTTQPFVAQAVEQSEESVRLAEATIALLNLIVGAIGEDGGMRCELVAPRAVLVRASGTEPERTSIALRALTARTGIGVDPADAAVILTFPDTSG